MKLLVHKHEGRLRGIHLTIFNETEFLKSDHLRCNHKGKGAPALALDGTAMTTMAGQKYKHLIVLNGGDSTLPIGKWTTKNYRSKSDHPGYEEWLSRIKWTAAEAREDGVPSASINKIMTTLNKSKKKDLNATLTIPKKSKGKDLSGPEMNENDQEKNADDSRLNANEFKNEGYEFMTATPSESSRLSSARSNCTTPEPFRSEAAISEPSPSKPSSSVNTQAGRNLPEAPESNSTQSQASALVRQQFASLVVALSTLEANTTIVESGSLAEQMASGNPRHGFLHHQL
ncbi:hypothetical protein VC83_01149 [Pseudogymnoascus destructans]|uniref:Uncharacterized protein n=1 Tax=Pseudogymnoascus destructans TaxID=655981 RepID=A0A177AKS7_9PEZI|nr:uncharacterized protein VC83_01149 [Pseudogymnoascus destructans]OAF62687.1 hypothetical protein VC83_01149 [Pseudogymnoascus destructans]